VARLDDRLRRDLERAARPADPSSVYEGLIRRRERRRIARKVRAGALAFVVIAGTAAGVYGLSRVFLGGSVTPGDGSSPSVNETPSPSPSAEPGRDLGLGFPVCNVTSVRGHFIDTQTSGIAYVATKLGDTGGCPEARDAFNVVAVDFLGDGEAEISFGPIECEPFCSAFAAPDVDDDGTDELLIQNIQFSIAGLRLYEVRADPAEVIPVTVATPGYPEGGFPPGVEPQFWLGGDGFQLDTLRCFATGATGPGRVLIQTSASQVPPDSPDSVWQATATWFDLNADGTVTVVDAGTFEEPVDADPLSFAQGNGICGARLPGPYGSG